MMRLACALLLLVTACNPPPPRDRIRFAHGPHLAEGMTCLSCHAGAVPEDGGEPDDPPQGDDPPRDVAHEASRDRPLLPSEDSCRSCHDDPVRDRCGRCHTAPARPGAYAPREDDIRFDHEAHEDADIGRCVRCHGRESASVRTFEPARPSMDTCTSGCHQDDMRALRCVRCHEDLHRYRIDDIALIEHPPGFVRQHGTSATVDSALCTQCHEPSFCEDCHLSAPGAPLEAWMPDRAYLDFVHRGDFLARHAIESNLERGTCARCHGVGFCDGCHIARGIGGSVAPGSPHPPGWLDPTSSFGHAQAARRDLLSCVSCHEADAERTCVPCHRVGGVASSPHPPGFGLGVDPLQTGVCRTCHVP